MAEASVLLAELHTHLHMSVCSLWGTQTTCSNLLPKPQHRCWQGLYPMTPGERLERGDQRLKSSSSLQIGPESLSKHKKRPYLNTKTTGLFQTELCSSFSWLGISDEINMHTCPLRMSKGPRAQERSGHTACVCGGLRNFWRPHTWQIPDMDEQTCFVLFIFLDVTVWPLEPNVQNPLASDQNLGVSWGKIIKFRIAAYLVTNRNSRQVSQDQSLGSTKD